MPVDKKKFDNFNTDYKDNVFDAIDRYTPVRDIIESIETCAKKFGEIVDIPDIRITTNNKLAELSLTFKNSNTTMFAYYYEHLDRIGTSVVGDAIIHDLMSKLKDGIVKLEECTKFLTRNFNKRCEAVNNLYKEKFIKRTTSIIKYAFSKTPTDIDFVFNDEEKKEFERIIEDYNNIDREIWNYNLEDNLVSSIVKEIYTNYPHMYAPSISVPAIINTSIIKELKSLGLEHLEPVLKDALLEVYSTEETIEEVNDEEIRGR